MKVGIGGIYHETHTFSVSRTEFDNFNRELHIGREIIDYYDNTKTSIGGFISGAKKNNDEIFPVLYTAATPSALVTKKAFEKIIDMFLNQLSKAYNLDAFLLAQHGAMCVEGLDDVEGYFMNMLKNELKNIPLIVTVDYHANISPKMVANSDCIVGYDTYPHVDIFERAVDAYKVLSKSFEKNIKIQNAYLHIPMIAAPQSITTESGIMKDVVQMANESEKNDDIFNITISGGFAYSDIPYAGIGIIVSFEKDANKAKETVLKFGRYIWEGRQQFKVANIKVEDAVEDALNSDKFPVILADVADNIGGGTPGDGTELLRELIRKNAENAVVVIADREAVNQCILKGIDQTISLNVGGNTDNMHGSPISIKGKIILISSGEFTNIGKNMTGLKTRMGKTVVLEVNKMKVVLTEFPTPPNDPGMFVSLGIDLSREKILVEKGGIAWKTGLNVTPGKIIYVDTPGLCNADLNSFNYKNLNRPIYPFDDFDPDLEKLVCFF